MKDPFCSYYTCVCFIYCILYSYITSFGLKGLQMSQMDDIYFLNRRKNEKTKNRNTILNYIGIHARKKCYLNWNCFVSGTCREERRNFTYTVAQLEHFLLLTLNHLLGRYIKILNANFITKLVNRQLRINILQILPCICKLSYDISNFETNTVCILVYDGINSIHST